MSDILNPARSQRSTSTLVAATAVAFGVFVSSFLLSSCGESGPKGPAAKGGGGGGGGAVPVVAGEVMQKDMPMILPGIGNVRAFSQVTIKPRVSGQVDKVMFTEGQEVNEGDIVIQMDPKPFEVALTQAKARLEQAESAEELAQIRADRGQGLQKSGAVAREEIDQLKNALRVAKANVEVEKAAVRGAELQLSYCTIRSPLRGRTGRRAVDAGNVVKADETDLMSIYQLRPIEVLFSLPEQHLGEITRQMKAGDLAVTIKPNESGASEELGKLTFVDNTVKATTGTIDLKAQFPNEDLTLWPGQYGEIALTLSVQKGAIVVPSAAVQTGQDGSFVYVVKSDNTAEVRAVKVQRVLREESIISEGLKAGEIVVVDGQLRLTPGVKVELKPPVGSEHSRGSQPIAQDGVSKGAPVP